MTGAKFLSRKSALAKALTSASIGKPSTEISDQVRPAIAAATGGCVTDLPGGLPIHYQGHLLGAVGVGSTSWALFLHCYLEDTAQSALVSKEALYAS